MRRREFITLLGGIGAWPLMARAQEPGRVYRLGCLLPADRQRPAYVAFFDELRLHGFVEGNNLDVLPGGFDVEREQIDAMVESIVKAVPDVIISGPDRYTRALQEATQTIPILGMSEDMVADGLVVSLSRPGGNTTGISVLSPLLDGKRQDLLIEAVPGVRRIAAFLDSTRMMQGHVQQLQDAAQTRGIEVSVWKVATSEEVIGKINAVKAAGVEAINFLSSPLFTVNAQTFIEHLIKLRLPAVHQWPELADEGGLVAYGPRFTEVFRQRARMVVKVLRGTRPVDIPVEQPTRFELVINLTTAKAIGHEVPAGLVLRADKVIE
jgi:putative tryptophan/tyrosine transport system substrate-binding protein